MRLKRNIDPIDIAFAEETASLVTGVQPEEIYRRTRINNIVWARFFFMYILTDLMGYTNKAVGLLFGSCHHRVMHARRAVAEVSSVDIVVAKQVSAIRRIVRNAFKAEAA